MAADILLYRADAVPVGEDQKQHVELTRDLAERFNNAFGKTFVVPEPVIRTEGGARHGARRPDEEDEQERRRPRPATSRSPTRPTSIRRKIKRAVTDSGTEVRPGDDKPALTNLLDDLQLVQRRDRSRPSSTRYAGKGYADFKADLADVVVDALAPLQARIRELEADKAYMLGVLKDGAERAEAIASRTMQRVRERVGLVPRPE